MSKVILSDLRPGMKVIRAVTNEHGIVLINENTELTDALIERLKHMNVDGVYIKGMSKSQLPKEEMLAALEKRFEKVENEQYMDILKKAIKGHIEELYGQH